MIVVPQVVHQKTSFDNKGEGRMKKMIALAAIASLTGCAAAGVSNMQQGNIDNNFVFDQSYDEVWSSTVEWFASNNIPIDNVDKASGLISSNYGLNPGMGVVDCGEPTGNIGLYRARFEDMSGNINIIVREVGPEETRATVNVFGNALVVVRNAYGVVSSANVRCVSTGSLESRYEGFVRMN